MAQVVTDRPLTDEELEFLRTNVVTEAIFGASVVAALDELKVRRAHVCACPHHSSAVRESECHQLVQTSLAQK